MNDAWMNIVGTVTKDPMVIENENGKRLIANVAVRTKKKDENGNAVANFFSVVCRGVLAEKAEKKLQKGTLVFATGEFYSEACVRDNNAFTRMNIDATEIKALARIKPFDENDKKNKEILSYVNSKLRNGATVDMDDVRDIFDEEEEDPTE